MTVDPAIRPHVANIGTVALPPKAGPHLHINIEGHDPVIGMLLGMSVDKPSQTVHLDAGQARQLAGLLEAAADALDGHWTPDK